MNDMSEQPRFRTMMKQLRANLTEEKDCLFLLHTPIGVINVGDFSYRVPGFVMVLGDDDQKNYRCLVFGEEDICSFPLEVKRKTAKPTKATLGFKQSE
jgi:hypothetical protein